MHPLDFLLPNSTETKIKDRETEANVMGTVKDVFEFGYNAILQKYQNLGENLIPILKKRA